jgi:hypothetical protein
MHRHRRRRRLLHFKRIALFPLQRNSPTLLSSLSSRRARSSRPRPGGKGDSGDYQITPARINKIRKLTQPPAAVVKEWTEKVVKKKKKKKKKKNSAHSDKTNLLQLKVTDLIVQIEPFAGHIAIHVSKQRFCTNPHQKTRT